MRRLIAVGTTAVVCCFGLVACTGSDDKGAPTATTAAEALKLGAKAETKGVGGHGEAEIRPDTVVYATHSSFGAPANGLFVVVNFTARNRTGGKVKTTLSSGGFRWMGSHGRTVTSRNTPASRKVEPIGFSEGGPNLPTGRGGYHQDVAVFDVTATDKGGILVYVDGDGRSFRWKIPAKDAGSSVPALKFALT